MWVTFPGLPDFFLSKATRAGNFAVFTILPRNIYLYFISSCAHRLYDSSQEFFFRDFDFSKALFYGRSKTQIEDGKRHFSIKVFRSEEWT